MIKGVDTNSGPLKGTAKYLMRPALGLRSNLLLVGLERLSNNQYYALGLFTDPGGWELRNRKYKLDRKSVV